MSSVSTTAVLLARCPLPAAGLEALQLARLSACPRAGVKGSAAIV